MSTLVNSDPVVVITEQDGDRNITTYKGHAAAAEQLTFLAVRERIGTAAGADTPEHDYGVACVVLNQYSDALKRRFAEYIFGTPSPASNEAEAAALVAEIGHLVRKAKAMGFVVTVEQVPLQPLAMGHYTPVVHARPARNRS